MLSTAQLEKIDLLSDTLLYDEAVSFVQRLVRVEHCNPLPTSQVTGLLNIAESFRYDELYRFITHQRDRNWPPSKSDIKTFYSALEQVLSIMMRKRLREEFHLLTERPGGSISEMRQEADALMARLAREFIQHLVAENGLIAAKMEDERRQQRMNRR